MNNFVIPTEGLKKKFEQQFIELAKEVKKPNILLLGKTGVGKSSLINTIFDKELAKISDIKPETRGFHVYPAEDCPNDIPVRIIDSEGYELDETNKFKESLDQYIKENFTDITAQIHLAWYCVSLSSARILPYDLDNIEYISKKLNIPTCVVITQCDNDTPDGEGAKAMSAVVYKKFGRHIPCFQASNDKELNHELDVEKMIDWSVRNLNDENLRLGFLMAQKASLEKKKESIETRMKYYAGAAAAIGATPIPMSDAILLTALQVKMAADIFAIYGLDQTMSCALKNIIGSRLISMLGKTIAGNLIKLIPGVGSAVGGAINASVAAFITYSFGYALNILAKKAVENEWMGDLVNFEELFSEDNIQCLIEEYQKKNVYQEQECLSEKQQKKNVCQEQQ